VTPDPRPAEGRRDAARAASVTIGAALGLWALAMGVMALISAVTP